MLLDSISKKVYPKVTIEKQICLSIFMLLLSLFSVAQTETYFQHLDSNDGLSQNDVLAIHQDSYGYIWIGTDDGLNRYDGRNFKKFKPSPKNPYAISGNLISTIAEDSLGNLWIGTSGYGINFYERNTGRFYVLTTGKNNTSGLASDFIRSIIVDRKNRLWIGTTKGLQVARNASDYKNIIFNSPFTENHHTLKTIPSTIFEDQQGAVWIGTPSGLLKTEAEDKAAIPQIKQVYRDTITVREIAQNTNGQMVFATSNGIYTKVKSKKPEDLQLKKIAEQAILKMAIDSKNRLWSGTKNGLDQYRLKLDTLILKEHHDTSFENKASLSSNYIRSLLIDKTGILWVGTFGTGINKLDLNGKQFNHYVGDLRTGTLGHNIVKSIYEDSNGTLWFGTRGGLGMLLKEESDGTFTHFRAIEKVNSAFCMNEIEIDDRKILELGNSGSQGVYQIDITAPSKKPKIKFSGKTNSTVFSMCTDRFGQVWYGTYSKGLFRSGEAPYEKLDNFADSFNFSSKIIRTIIEDSKGNLWVGTGKGLNKLSADQLQDEHPEFKYYAVIENDSTSISNNYILPIFESSKGTIWIGTLGGGLNKFIDDKTTGKEYFKAYTEADGLPNNVIKSIEEDNEGNLWISTNSGISKFNPLNETFKNYDVEDGLQSNEFEELTSLKKSDGELIFGGVNGFNAFYPRTIKENTIPPEIHIDRFLLNNKLVSPNRKIDGKEIIDHTILTSEEINLNYNENNISLGFSALHFSSPNKNQSQYRLKGFQDDWIEAPVNRNLVTYTNLEPGTYSFEVKAANSDGFWNLQPDRLQIIIAPPFWKTIWAYAIYVLLAILLLYTFGKFTLIRIEEKHQLKMDHLTKQKADELNKMKMEFFTNVSHEFRTPLSLLNAPLQFLEKNNDIIEPKERLNQYRLMQKNSSLLLRLVNQLLDFQKIEQKKMVLEVGYFNILKNIKEIKESFDFLAKNRSIQFSLNCEEDELITWFSPDALEKVMNNLLSNAFKFTPDGGEISVVISNISKEINNQKEEFVKIEVRDNGNGISSASLEKIFDRFFNDDSAENRNTYGMGIGLALTKSLVQRHHGEIIVEKGTKKGANFIFFIPKKFDFYKDDKIIGAESTKAMVHPNLDHLKEVNFKTEDEDEIITTNEKPILLVVEDNADLRTFIKSGLYKKYEILEAENGQQGLDILKVHTPNIIISDIMMPTMDGISFAREVKKQVEYNHIPIVFLTAKTDDDTQLQGLKIGVDDYLTKPFNLEHLEVKLNNIMRYRKDLRNYIQREVSISPSEIKITSPDQEFLNRVIELLEMNIMDAEFNAESLTAALAMSRSAVYNKFKEFTGLSTGEFIRRFRLKRAKQLLESTDLTVKEILYMSGFNTASYFTKCFKKVYGELPKEYQAARRKTIKPANESLL
ncbi:hybrid sensor histidine kinase/response regulator transcription factor [Zobellia uliginosa]|uniref:hybrid sensor histidine kinase/response regulator transcription factor n=1 Tax=Zobellia uliginosa TaxID=143224 RepID=UPI001C07A9B8|nr:two-component regulator propeller domain-containing protein [Zobellia uliginosa]MBU2945469.1 response regulator [Zobellia uliginosa]